MDQTTDDHTNGAHIVPGPEHQHEAHVENTHDEVKHAPKRRRKVNHACVYCRRSHMTCDLERPCTRCIKRNIGHLCHDEPREHDNKKVRLSIASAAEGVENGADLATTDSQLNQALTPVRTSFDNIGLNASGQGFGSSPLGRKEHSSLQQLVTPGVVGTEAASLAGSNNMNQFPGLADVWMTAQNQLQDEQNYDSNYMLNPEVTNEFNLLNDFLHSSLLDDGAILPGDQREIKELSDDTMPSYQPQTSMLPPTITSRSSFSTTSSTKQLSSPVKIVLPEDKRREYYLQAADPSGNDTPEERMQRVLKAKQDAGLLKPFNYIQGYKRLSTYLDSHIAAASKQKILRQINHFRPRFREKMQALTDMELIYVEMWFEKTLMEYDRVFSSMAVPACCWRRTGEIFRGNREMAELIHVPVEKLREGKIALHEILTEESVVRYWEEFGTIAFDPIHDTLLTACSVKNPDDNAKDPIIKCCFSIKIRRDDHKIPSLIVGNFLPHDPPPH